MLEQLLDAIRAGGTLEVGALAAQLGITPQLVEVMLEHLQRGGYIHAYLNCDNGCRSCGLRDACRKQDAVRLWQGTLDSQTQSRGNG